ncbi:MAG TPA: FKBP-type peptidyl-prolyl cis-trans isomerase [Blastocatellia bacterium]|nr:FKBP-type peptidyl-prolyl cis-trans isomerase [Blastocatellia bacterium]
MNRTSEIKTTMRNAKIFRAFALDLSIVFLAVIAYCAEWGKGAQAIQMVTQQRVIAAPPDVATPPSDARTTASGVAMKVLKPGLGAERPRDNDCVKAHFTVWQRDGAMLASSRLRGAVEVQCMRTVFPGVAEALKTMVTGEERRIWVPGRLTFTSADEDDTPPKVDITMDIESRVCMKERLAWSSAKRDAFGFLPPLLTERSEVVAASPPETWSTTSNSCQWNRDNQTSDTVNNQPERVAISSRAERERDN